MRVGVNSNTIFGKISVAFLNVQVIQIKTGIEMCQPQRDQRRQSEFGVLEWNNLGWRISLLYHSPALKKQNKQKTRQTDAALDTSNTIRELHVEHFCTLF